MSAVRREQLPPLTEKAFQRQVVDLAKMLGWRVYHPFLSKWSERGFPDLTMVREKDHRLLFAELKRDGAKPTPAQEEWLIALGAVAVETIEIEAGPGDSEAFLAGVSAGLQLAPRVEVVLWHPGDWPEIERTLR
jgi:hypothetical protein